jgi:hypothetical protein
MMWACLELLFVVVCWFCCGHWFCGVKTLHLHLTSTVEYALNIVDAEAVVVLGM